MWTIRQEQTENFRQYHLQKFEDEMVVHSKKVASLLCALIGDAQVRLAVRRGISQAQTYGFTNRGPIRLFIELQLLFGSGFDTDPQYPWAAAILLDHGHEMTRADLLRGETLQYQEKVSGKGAAHTYEALRRLSVLATTPLTFSSSTYESGIFAEMGRIFPEKAAYVGVNGLHAVLREGIDAARRLDFPSPRGELLVVALMMAFGHGCINDPLYPWIHRTLVDEKIVSAAARAERLEKKALTWLSHVLALPIEENRDGA